MRTVYMTLLAVALLVFVGCGQAEQGKREAIENNVEEIGQAQSSTT